MAPIVYVCGDAKRMAKDVEGRWSTSWRNTARAATDQAIAFVTDLKKQGRYQQDVY